MEEAVVVAEEVVQAEGVVIEVEVVQEATEVVVEDQMDKQLIDNHAYMLTCLPALSYMA